MRLMVEDIGRIGKRRRGMKNRRENRIREEERNGKKGMMEGNIGKRRR